MSGIYPSPEHIEHIQFDGRDCVVLSPEDYEEMHFDITRLRARVAELTADVESRAEDCELNYKTILELRKIITEQDAALAKREAVAVPECFLALYRAALGPTHGEDWNNGTAASFHRIPLIDATGRCAELLAASGRQDGAR